MANQTTVHNLVISTELRVEGAQSLKDKRRAVKTCVERLKNSFNASVIEVGHGDKWQRAGICLSMLSTDKAYLDRAAAKVESLILEVPNVQIIAIDQEWL